MIDTCVTAGDVMTDSIKGDFAALQSIWRTVSDTDKVGVVSRLEGLLRRLRATGGVEDDPGLEDQIQDLINEIRASLATEPA
jgi:hypothetical protein